MLRRPSARWSRLTSAEAVDRSDARNAEVRTRFSRLRRGGWLSLGCRRLAPRVEPQRERTQPPIVPRADLAPQARRGGGEALRHL